MSRSKEYIIDTEKINELNRGNVTSWLSPYAISDTSGFPPRIKETHFAVTLPRIIRCSDCKHLLTQEPTGLLVCEREHDKSNWYMPVDPDGFCAWAVREVDA